MFIFIALEPMIILLASQSLLQANKQIQNWTVKK